MYLDSFTLDSGKVSALLKVDRGPSYKIDSIRVFGDAKISNLYLQRYLDIPNGSIYNKTKLQQVTSKIRQLPYVQEEQPSTLTRLGTGSVLKASKKFVDSGLIRMESERLLLTKEGKLLADGIASDIFV